MRFLFSLLLFHLYTIASTQVFSDETSLVDIQPFNVEIRYGSGSNLVDVDQNGFVDLFVVAGTESPNLLYLNNGNSWSSPISIGIDDLNSRAAVWFDFNNDKFLDVFILSDCANTEECFDGEAFALYKNNGNQTFSNVSTESLLVSGERILSDIDNKNYSGGVTAGDVNLDGFLDLLITRWGGELFLFTNNGDGTFQKSSQILNHEGLHFYWQPLIFNLDDDIWPEIFVTLDAGEEDIYLDRQLRQGVFKNKARELNLNHKFHDMGVVIGDYDNDNDYDLFISNIERHENSRNVLFNRSSDSVYVEVAHSANVDEAGWAWGISFSDFNNDGLLDLGITNGWETHDLYRHDQSKLWLGSSSFEFIDASSSSHFNDTLNASSLSSADIDRDGDIDLVQGLKSYEKKLNLRLLKNNLRDECNECNYLTVKPRMIGQNHWAIGSSVSIKSNGNHQMRAITAGVGFYSQEPAEAFFGLGNSSIIDQVSVRWPSGDSTIIYNVDANQELFIYDSLSIHNVGLMSLDVIDSVTLKLKWGHMTTSETHFVIQRSEQNDFSNAEEVTLTKDQNEYLDTNLKSFTNYYYRIKAVGSTAESKWSNTYPASTRLTAHAPADFNGSLVANNSVELTWNDTSKIDLGYELQRSLSSDFKSTLSYFLDAEFSSYLDTNLEPGFTYFYRIKQNSEIYLCPFSESDSLAIPKISIPLASDDMSSIKFVYPNPSNGLLHLNEIDNIDAILVHSLNGQQVSKFLHADFASEKTIHIDKKGIFILSFYQNQKLITNTKIQIR